MMIKMKENEIKYYRGDLKVADKEHSVTLWRDSEKLEKPMRLLPNITHKHTVNISIRCADTETAIDCINEFKKSLTGTGND